MKAFILSLFLLICPISAFAVPIHCMDSDVIWHELESNGKNIIIDGVPFYYQQEFKIDNKRMSIYEADTGEKANVVLIIEKMQSDVYLDVYTKENKLIFNALCAI